MRIDDDIEVRAPHRRLQVGIVGAKALPVLMRELADPGPFICAAIVVRLLAEARSAGGFHERIRQRARITVRRDDHGTVVTAGVIPILSVPGLLRPESRRHIRPPPSGGAGRHPAVEVSRMTPLMNLGVDVGGPSQHLPARSEYPTPADGHLRLALKRPIEVALEEFREARRDRNEPTRRRSSGLDQQHLEFAGFAQSLRKNAPRRSCTDDDQIVHVPSCDTSLKSCDESLKITVTIFIR